MTGTKLSRRRVASMLGAMAVAGSTAWLTVGGAASVHAQTTTTEAPTTTDAPTTTTPRNTTTTDPSATTTTARSGGTTTTTRSGSSATTSTIPVGGPATAVAGRATFTG